MGSENISLSSVSTSLSADTRKKVDRLKVRECDEHPKGTFIAYIDDGDQSFDAMVVVGKGKLLTAHACDCGSGNTLCIHRIALLLFVANGSPKSSSTKIPKSKKKLPHELVLENIDVDALKSWVARLFIKNKDLELAFLNHFNPESKIYTIEDAIFLTVQGRKAVIKNRRKAEVSEVKKIVELWKELHQPIVDAFRSSLGDEKMFKVFNAMLLSIAEQHNSIESGSKAMVKYLFDLLHKSVEPVRNLVLDATWKKAITLFVHQIGEASIDFNHAYFEFLMELAGVSDDERKVSIISSLLERCKKLGRMEHFINVQQIRQLLDITVDAKQFEKYADIFKPLLYYNEFNLYLIEVLISHQFLDKAEHIALEQIERNVRHEYDYAYYLKLRKVHLLSGDMKRLAKVIEFTFPINFDYDDFLFLQAYIKEEFKQKKWTETIFSRAEMAAKNGNQAAEIFCFRFLHHEHELSRMVALVSDTWDYETLVYYFDEMHQTDSQNLLANIISRANNAPYWQMDEKQVKERKWHQPLAEKILAVYSAGDIKKAIAAKHNSKYYSSKGRFTIYLEDKIK